jgi:tetrahydromethanopterin S-methyltransferase subunit A
MYITVLPAPEHTTISSQYYGIIHGIGEEERKELRRFINSVFFRTLDTEKANDANEVAKIKQQYVQKQEEAIEEKKKIAAAEAKEKEEEQKKAQELAEKAKNIVDELD